MKSTETKATVAVIGLGAMGSRMAARLLEAGHPLVVHNRSEDRAATLIEAGARWAPSPRAAAEEAEVVLSMVRDEEASEAIWLDPDRGALAGLREGATAIESSTLRGAWIRALAAKVEAAGGRLLEAPVVGTRPHAEAGGLHFLVGGDPALVEEVRPILRAMGASIRRVGGPGSAAAVKLAVNAMFAVQAAAYAELLGLLLREAEGGPLELEAAVEAFGAMPVMSPALAGVAAATAAERYTPLFPVELVEKDLAYAEASAEAREARAPMAAAARQVFAEALEAGLGEENLNAVAKLYR